MSTSQPYGSAVRTCQQTNTPLSLPFLISCGYAVPLFITLCFRAAVCEQTKTANSKWCKSSNVSVRSLLVRVSMCVLRAFVLRAFVLRAFVLRAFVLRAHMG